MKIERKTIYKDKRNCYRLIFGTSKFGVNMAYLTDVAAYNGIVGVKIDDIGYVAFDRIMYIPWNKFNDYQYTEYRKLSDREYNQITMAVYQFLNGDIASGPNSILMYRDELEAATAEDIENDTKEVIEEKTVEKTTITTVEENKVEKTTITMVESKSTVDSKSKEEERPVANIKHDKTCFSTPRNLTKVAKDHNISADTNEKSGGVKYFDLLAPEPRAMVRNNSNYDEISKRTSQSSRVNIVANRHIFDEDEALAISAMNATAVASVYKVSSAVARLMIRNAKRIFDFEIESGKVKRINNFSHLFKLGYSIEEVSKITNTDLSFTKQKYDVFAASSNEAKDNNAAIAKWDAIISQKDYNAMISAVYDYSIVKFALQENCSTYTAENIVNKVKNVLYFNPLFCVGFGKSAQDVAQLESDINNRRDSKYIKDMIDVWLYDKVMDLYDAYTSSYNSHAEILAGTKSVPDSVSEKDKDYFMSLIYNRFNIKLINKSRVLTNVQKKAIESNSVMERSKAFMVRHTKAYALKNR